MLWLYTAVTFVLLLALILMTPLNIQLKIEVIAIHSQLRIDIFYMFLFKKVRRQYLLDLDLILHLWDDYKSSEDKKTENNWFRHWKKKLKYDQENLDNFYYFFRYSKVKQLVWLSTIGWGEADKTGFYTGSLWALKGICIALLSKKRPLNDFKINITPDFSNKVFSSQFSCILAIRFVHIIPISTSILLSKIRGYHCGIRKTAKIKPSY